MRTKQVRPDKMEFEYELYLSYNKELPDERMYVLFDFRTTKIFEHFIYKINATQKVDLQKKEIIFNIEGLSAPVLDLSHSGHSEYAFKLYDFKFTDYTIKMLKNGKSPHTYILRFTKNGIKIKKKPQKSFIKIIIQ